MSIKASILSGNACPHDFAEFYCCSHSSYNSLINLIPSPICYICVGLLVDTHIGPILSHNSIRPYGHRVIFWGYGHIALWLYGSEWGQYGYLLKAQYKCSNLAKELNWLDYYKRNESKNRIVQNFPLYIFPNPFIKKWCLGGPQALRLHK